MAPDEALDSSSFQREGKWAVEVGKDTQKLLDYVLSEPDVQNKKVALFLVYVMTDIPCAMGISFRVSQTEPRVANIHERHIMTTVVKPLVMEIAQKHRIRVHGHVEREDKQDMGLCEAARKLRVSRLIIPARRSLLRVNEGFAEFCCRQLFPTCSIVVVQAMKRKLVSVRVLQPPGGLQHQEEQQSGEHLEDVGRLLALPGADVNGGTSEQSYESLPEASNREQDDTDDKQQQQQQLGNERQNHTQIAMTISSPVFPSSPSWRSIVLGTASSCYSPSFSAPASPAPSSLPRPSSRPVSHRSPGAAGWDGISRTSRSQGCMTASTASGRGSRNEGSQLLSSSLDIHVSSSSQTQQHPSPHLTSMVAASTSIGSSSVRRAPHSTAIRADSLEERQVEVQRPRSSGASGDSVSSFPFPLPFVPLSCMVSSGAAASPSAVQQFGVPGQSSAPAAAPIPGASRTMFGRTRSSSSIHADGFLSVSPDPLSGGIRDSPWLQHEQQREARPPAASAPGPGLAPSTRGGGSPPHASLSPLRSLASTPPSSSSTALPSLSPSASHPPGKNHIAAIALAGELQQLQRELNAAHTAELLLQQTVEEAQDELRLASEQAQVESLRRVACEAELEGAKWQAQVARRTVAQLQAEVEAARRAAAEALAMAQAAQRQCEDERDRRKGEFRYFTYTELAAATGNFSLGQLLGEGSYGLVYAGVVDHTPVAVRRMKYPENTMALEEFRKEVQLGGGLRHPHIVLLLGCCECPPCLVYEHMPQGSLYDRLTCLGGSTPLPWTKRFDILRHICAALIHLHCRDRPIVLFDLKPSNILLDNNFVAKLGDVGLARIMKRSSSSPTSSTSSSPCSSIEDDPFSLGSLGYACPELIRSHLFSSRTDVFSLGMVMYDLLGVLRASGRVKGLIKEIEEAVEDGDEERLGELTDPDAQWPPGIALEIGKIARDCTQARRKDRPDVGGGVMPQLERLRASVEKAAAAAEEEKRRERARVMAEAMEEEVVDVPNGFKCPITLEVMEWPVIASDGHTYEKAALEKWLLQHDTSPKTNMFLRHKELTPNHALRSLINDWREKVQRLAN